jgi:hypothetical protein
MGDSQSQKAGDNSTQVQAAGNVSITVGLSYADFKLALAGERERIVEQVWERAQEMIKEAGVPPGPVPLKTTVPLLQQASLEEDEGLQERWAALLANAASGQRFLSRMPAFINFLRDLSPDDAEVLDALYSAAYQACDEQGYLCDDDLAVFSHLDIYAIQDRVHADVSQVLLGNLRRLGLITSKESDSRPAAYGLTYLGAEFMLACKKPHPRSPIE